MTRFILSLCLLLPMMAPADGLAWTAWREGKALLIMRHTLAPGTGDPANFTLGDCSTQRNLNVIGQQQAKAWGERLRQHYSDAIQVFSSQWCRCLDTAKLMALGDVTPMPLLNSFFAGRGDGDKQNRALVQQFAQSQLAKPTVLVTHQVNFTALTGIFPQSGEAAIIALPLSQPATVLARLDTP
ncbi:histidine phosphatase family protein [Rheinheimera baltica]|uniref:histidine phosphatase family protein n=1 Tax=Rheinheimera baltica TaxID=67576 RepID=UPI00273E64E4|nr:histidine phosphatase family protein [Rheinheimera baltica]MDP5142395.1 histidine phosphatase family protein [Rheinheimera baltica]